MAENGGFLQAIEDQYFVAKIAKSLDGVVEHSEGIAGGLKDIGNLGKELGKQVVELPREIGKAVRKQRKVSRRQDVDSERPGLTGRPDIYRRAFRWADEQAEQAHINAVKWANDEAKKANDRAMQWADEQAEQAHNNATGRRTVIQLWNKPDEARMGQREVGRSWKRAEASMAKRSINLSLRVWYDDNSRHIKLAGPALTASTVSNDPTSKRYHPNLFRKLAKALRDAGAPAPEV